MYQAASAYKKMQATTQDRAGVLLMMYDGIIKQLRRALFCLRSGNRGSELAILKAQSGIVELDKTLNFKANAQLAESLHNLYLHMLFTLGATLEEPNIAEITRVQDMLQDLRDTWFEASQQARVNNQVPDAL